LARLLTRSGTPDPVVAAGPVGSAIRWSARRWALLVAVGWLFEFGLRVWLSSGQSVPLANPDESAYLIAARVLAGGPATDFSYSTLYQAGYPLLLAPVYWFTSNAVVVYHSVMVINSAFSALLMPLAYVAGRRLGLVRPAAYAVALVTALLPAGLFYAQYAMTDAIYPVLVLAFLLALHSWLTARTARGQWAAAAGSALLAGYSYSVHSRGIVIVASFAVVAVLAAWRRLVPWRTLLAAGVVLAASLGAAVLLDRYLSATMYPEGARDLRAQMVTTLHSVNGVLDVVEMAAGQLWRLVLDSWGVAGIGLMAAVAVIFRPRFRADLRIMAAVGVAITVVTAATAPAALPQDQSQTWASGRYLDGMIVTFFVVGAVVLLRARPRFILICAAATAVVTVLSALMVYVYAGSSLPTSAFSTGFNFGEPAVLTQDWNSASVWISTLVALALLGVWVAIALAARRQTGAIRGIPVSRALRGLAVAGLAAVSLVASIQMTFHISRAATPAQAASTTGFVAATGLKPGDQIAAAYTIGTNNIPPTDVPYYLWAPQAFEVTWTELEFFNPAQAPPAGVNVVETGWPSGQPASAGWPNHPAGWKIVASDQSAGWVAWRKS
jgi:hypothetical protein